MTEEEIIKEMQKPIGAALTATEWFLVFGFVDFAMAKDEMFASTQDMEAMKSTVLRLHNQVFPPRRDNSEEFADVIALKPKKLILPKGADIIV